MFAALQVHEDARTIVSKSTKERLSWAIALPLFPPTGRLFLDLGTVKNVAVVRLNGKNLGILWCAPWRVDITKSVKSTGNVLKVDKKNARNARFGEG